MRSCTVVGCERPHHSSGYCTMHYQRVRKFGTPDPPRPCCVECGAKLLRPASSSRPTPLCGACHARGAWRKHNPAQNAILRERDRAKIYGLTVEEMRALLSRKVCGICGSLEPRGRGDWHIDHDHESGRVRGLLCFPCNQTLGYFEAHRDQMLRYLDT